MLLMEQVQCPHLSLSSSFFLSQSLSLSPFADLVLGAAQTMTVGGKTLGTGISEDDYGGK